MHSLIRVVVVLGVFLSVTAPVHAQDPPPRIGPFAVDLRGVVPHFPNSPDLAASRGFQPGQPLPGVGFGAVGGVHVYLPRIMGLTFGLGGEAIISRAHADAPSIVDSTTGITTPSSLLPVTETFKSFSPQLSLNFGNGHGWSYLSAGIGRSIWSIVPDGANPLPADEEILNTINYGGGARWFIKQHLAFSLDVRLYDIGSGTPQLGYPGSPGKVLLMFSAGISVK